MNSPDVRLDSDGGIRQLVFTAAQRRNALTAAMLADIADAVRTVAADREARALVVSGEGTAFCAGADLTSLFGDTTRPPAQIRDDLKRVYASFLGIGDLDIPTIAAVHGPAVGAGANIAMVCDLIIAGPDARFDITFADIGLHPGGGSSWLLTRRLGPQRAMAAILAAERIDVKTALRDRLIAEVSDDPLARALQLARQCAARDASLVRDIKRAVRMAETESLETVLEFESWAQASSVTMPGFRQYMDRFADRTRQKNKS
jgi:enoyl-CoA hydratase